MLSAHNFVLGRFDTSVWPDVTFSTVTAMCVELKGIVASSADAKTTAKSFLEITKSRLRRKLGKANPQYNDLEEAQAGAKELQDMIAATAPVSFNAY